MNPTPSASTGVLTDPDFWSGTEQDTTFGEFRRTAPISWQPIPQSAWHPDGGRGYWSVTSHRLVNEVSRMSSVFGSRFGTEIHDQDDRWLAAAGMLNMDAPEHTRLRSIVARAFTPRRIKEMMDHIEVRARSLVDHLTTLDDFDFVAEVGDTYASGIIGGLMDVPPSDIPMLVALTKRILGPNVEDGLEANDEMVAYGMHLAEQRHGRDGEDLVSLIVNADASEEALSIEEVGVFFALLLTAGIETTGTSLNHAAVVLHEHPDQAALWRSDLDRYTPTGIEEIFRWVTPVRRFRRTALVDVHLDGADIAAGDKVVIWYSSANRDESVFDEPHRFDISRSPNPHLAFGGGGPHFCLGASLARAETSAFMREFLTRLPDYSIIGDVTHAQSDAFNVVTSVPCSTGSTRR